MVIWHVKAECLTHHGVISSSQRKESSETEVNKWCSRRAWGEGPAPPAWAAWALLMATAGWAGVARKTSTGPPLAMEGLFSWRLMSWRTSKAAIRTSCEHTRREQR